MFDKNLIVSVVVSILLTSIIFSAIWERTPEIVDFQPLENKERYAYVGQPFKKLIPGFVVSYATPITYEIAGDDQMSNAAYGNCHNVETKQSFEYLYGTLFRGRKGEKVYYVRESENPVIGIYDTNILWQILPGEWQVVKDFQTMKTWLRKKTGLSKLISDIRAEKK